MHPPTTRSDAVGTFAHVGGEDGGVLEVLADGHELDANAKY